MNDVLKEELDFQVGDEFFFRRSLVRVVHYGDQGFLLSDWAAVESLYNSVMNGADMNMPGSVLSFHYRVLIS